MSTKLSLKTLPVIESATKPEYNREEITNGIVHLGIGSFHRAHQAVYTDTLLASGAHQWGITGVSLRSTSVYNTLAPQDFLYTVKTQDRSGSQSRVIGSIGEVIPLLQPGACEKILAQIANPNTQVVTLTITEKGYCHTINGELDSKNPSVVQDLQNPEQPQTAPGLLALGLKRRMEANAGPISVLSCDNLSGNGHILSDVVSGMVRQQTPTMTRWLTDNVSFPSSMVDRIVPKTKASDIAQLEQDTGYLDTGLVICEPFSQWVIEDNFAGEKPAWNIAGAEFVASVSAYEQTKLRFLNATHSALAYLGFLAGYRYIHEAMAEPHLASFAHQLMELEITPIVVCPEGFNLHSYKQSILKRFANDAVPYETSQVASDGSQKLPQRIFPTIQALLDIGKSAPHLTLVVAAWLQCLTSNSITDPQAKPLLELALKHSQPADLIQAIAAETEYFGTLNQSKKFLSALTHDMILLTHAGSLGAITKLLKL